MKRKNKTAVEWFFRELENVNGYSSFYTNNYQHVDALYNEAKQMEKKQIIESVDYCLASVKISDDKTVFTATTAEQYYNETYETKED